MRSTWKTLFGLVLVLVLIGCKSSDVAKSPDSDRGEAISEDAKEILKSMSQFLASKKDMHFNVYETIESFYGDKIIHSSNTLRIWIRYPDKIRAILFGDTLNRTATYDGKQLAIYDKNIDGYMIKKNVPDTIDKLLDFMAEKEGVVIPISDFFVSDTYKSLMRNVISGEVIGYGMLRDTKCYHLYFQQENIDWQIWISANEKEPIPLKLVIRYKNSEHALQYIAMIDKWDFSPIKDPGIFVFKKPEDVEEILFFSDIKRPLKLPAK